RTRTHGRTAGERRGARWRGRGGVADSLRDHARRTAILLVRISIGGAVALQCVPSQAFMVRDTRSAASCCTQCPALGTVTSVRALSSHCQVSLSAPGSSAESLSPWNISTGACTFTSGPGSLVYGSRG